MRKQDFVVGDKIVVNTSPYHGLKVGDKGIVWWLNPDSYDKITVLANNAVFTGMHTAWLTADFQTVFDL